APIAPAGGRPILDIARSSAEIIGRAKITRRTENWRLGQSPLSQKIRREQFLSGKQIIRPGAGATLESKGKLVQQYSRDENIPGSLRRQEKIEIGRAIRIIRLTVILRKQFEILASSAGSL